MKDSILINSRLPNGFWAEVMETANYLQDRLLTRNRTHGKMILKAVWIGRQQNIHHIYIFRNLTFCNILEEKRVKFDYQKVWKRILIEYNPDTSKHFCIWALSPK